MGKGRIEAFTDGVIAIIITIMVLELKVPHDASFAALREAAPVFLAYVLSFINVGIFWNNHHHMMHAIKHVDGRVLWANLTLLFFLSLVPFVIRWIDESGMVTAPVAAYGAVLTGAALGYSLLQTAIIAANPDSMLNEAIGQDWKGKSSTAGYLAGFVIAFWNPWVSIAIYIAISVMWFIPDRRIERKIPHD
jgi:uncharacterized membrane protein